ncbi:uncharacterized protein B0H64DRAFT_392145 [Chaetomium fimeti]|uniref:Uncharacterized protein n=1 Tax=Chaetomium fimeti TaxID=1854472 RepID=A0AAE0HIY4_9PEZI|nr:hypothetical protein B0H64DRAFT_392145 [Chaetomium fimeti]
MPTKGHQRSRSSIDRVIDLLADLEDTQISVLLDDLNHTTSSNVAVTDAIALFDHHANKPKRKKSCRSPSPMRTLQVELERRHSKRISAAPERQSRYRAAITQPPAPREPATPSPSPSPPPTEDLFGRPDSPDRPSLILPPQASFEHPKASSAGPPPVFRPRSYKRISRPMFLSPTATAELHLLLLAFFNETSALPVSPTTTATPPSPTRTPSFSGGRSLKTMPSISSIFEVMRSQ